MMAGREVDCSPRGGDQEREGGRRRGGRLDGKGLGCVLGMLQLHTRTANTHLKHEQ